MHFKNLKKPCSTSCITSVFSFYVTMKYDENQTNYKYVETEQIVS